MAGMAQTGMTRALDTLTGKTPYGLPSLWVALVKTATSAASAGTEILAADYGGYVRYPLVLGNWSGATTAGASTYNGPVDFGAASASSGASVVGFELWDAVTAGNRLWWISVTSIAISTGTHLSIASGQIVATVPPLAAGSGLSQTYCQKVCDHMTGKTAFGTAPALWCCLLSTAATATANGTELVYTGYARVQATTASLNNALAGANTDVVTNTQLNFGADTGGTQTAATFFSLMDASTVGNLVAGGTVTNGGVSSGVTPDFPVSSTLLRFN